MAASEPIPVIDLFAGPGGLGEGFSSLGRRDGPPRFKIRLSIERGAAAHQTPVLRAFFHQFAPNEISEEYCEHLCRRLSRAGDTAEAW